MSKKDKRKLESHLENLMAHILKWKNQIRKRSRSWENTIKRTRGDIEKLQRDQPSLTNDYLESIFDETLEKAKKAAQKEMQEELTDDKLRWDEVFKSPYILALIIFIFILIICW